MNMSGRKRNISAVDREIEVSEANDVEENVTIHGVVTELSAIKTSKKNSTVKYFTVMLSDGRKSLRMVSFDPKLRPRFNESFEGSNALAVKEFQVKRASYGDALEILASSRGCKVEPSERSFELPQGSGSVDVKISKEISIDDLGALALMQLVTVYVKVLFVGEPETIEPKNQWRVLTKQECIVADISATVRIVLWQSDVGALKEDQSYKIVDATVRLYQGVRYLSCSESCKIEEIDDIGDVAEIDSDEELSKSAKVITGYIKAVVSCEHYPSCTNCNAKIALERDGKDYDIIECCKCQCKTVRGRCDEGTVARVIIEASEKRYRVTIFEDVIRVVIKDVDMLASVSDKLVCGPQLQFTIKDEIIVSAKPLAVTLN